MSESTKQTGLSDFFHATDTTDEPFTKTIVLPLETSNRKTAYVETVIERWQEIAEHTATVLKSHRPSQWKPKQTVTYRAILRAFPERNGIKGSLAQEAGERVVEAYASWQSNGKPSNNHPAGEFGNDRYATIRTDDLTIEENDRGFGVKVSTIPYKPEWFHIDTEHNDRLETSLARIVDQDDPLRSGRGELRVDDEGTVRLHLSITDTIEVYEVGDVDRYLGVDLGETTVYTTALVDLDDVEAVTVESGREFRHYRDRLQRKRDEFQQRGDKPAKLAVSDERQRYTDHMTHVYAREVVDIAVENVPCAIVLEDLTNYRETAKDAIHDWPFHQLQEKIAYKATEAGIPVIWIDPAGTSTTCRKCGCDEPVNRSGTAFNCLRCGYEVHADVNAAVNIGHRGRDEQ